METEMNWLRELLERWLGIPELRKQIAALEMQLSAMGRLLSEVSSDVEGQSRRTDSILMNVNSSVIEVEERLLIRVAALEERTASGDYTKDEADAPSGGFIPWTERKRRAEMAASDPSKWLKKKEAVPQEK
jgi:hypothetical protein